MPELDTIRQTAERTLNADPDPVGRCARGAIRWLWEQQVGDGLWDFGRAAKSVGVPLSESWRRHTARRFDWTTRVLHLLRRYHRGQNEPFGMRVGVQYGDD
jgi:hypothetical protein